MKYNLSNIMKRAWEIKKENKENLFAVCLKMAWKEIRTVVVDVVEYLKSKGLKIWEKGDNKRIYINDLATVGIERFTLNPKGFRKVSLYYNMIDNNFYCNGATSSMKKTMEQLISSIIKGE